RLAGQKGPVRVAPIVLLRRSEIDRPRCDERDQLVEVDRQLLHAIAEGFEVGVVPIRKAFIDDFYGLAILTAYQTGSAATRLARDDKRKSFVLRACPHGHFPVA